MGSAIREHVIRTTVLEACTRAGVPHDSALRRQLESEAEIPDGSRDAYVRTSSGVSLDERISELKTVPKFAGGSAEREAHGADSVDETRKLLN